MHLVPKSQLYGQPAKALRDFFRKSVLHGFRSEALQHELSIGSSAAAALLTALQVDGLVKPDESSEGKHVLTPAGSQLAMATFAPQIKRERAEQLLVQVVMRAGLANSEKNFMFHIARVALFGSMLGTAPLVSDVDMAVEFVAKYGDDEWTAECQKRLDAADDQGRRFRSILHRSLWHRLEPVEFLRCGERNISLHSFNELIGLGCEFRLVFEEPFAV